MKSFHLLWMMLLIVLTGCVAEPSGHWVDPPGLTVNDVPDGIYHPIYRMWVDDDEIMRMQYGAPPRDQSESSRETIELNEVAIDTTRLSFREQDATHRFVKGHEFPHDEDLWVVAIQHRDGRYKALIRDETQLDEQGGGILYFLYSYDVMGDGETYVANILPQYEMPEVFDNLHTMEPRYFQAYFHDLESDR